MSPLKRWSSFFRSSFQFKLFSLFTLVTAVMTILLGTAYVFSEIRQERHYASEQLRLLTQGFADSIRLPLYAENNDVLVSSAEEILRIPGVIGVEIYAADGRQLVRIPRQSTSSSSHPITKMVEVRSSPLAPSPSSALESEQAAPGTLVGSVRLHRGTEDLSRSSRTLVATTIIVAVLFWMLVSGSCYLLLRRVTRSFQSLMRGLENMHCGDYISRIEVVSTDEPGRASVAVNDLAEALKRRDEENKRLTAELRSAMELAISSKEELASLNRTLEAEIVERTRAKQELKSLVEQLPVGVIWSDNNGAIEYVNRFVAEQFGYPDTANATIEEWFARFCADTECHERVIALRRTAIAAWDSTVHDKPYYDVEMVCKEGSIRHLLCGNQLSGGRVVDIMIDVTERELLQQQLIKNQKLESIGVLAGGIAHNFNNVITGILGYISLAQKFLDESHRSYNLLRYAEKASNRAAGLANELLTFAVGSVPVKKVVSIAKLVDESVFLATSGSRVESRLELPPSLRAVYVDEGQICQAFNCLCLNAVQAMPDGGVLTIRGRNVSTASETLSVPAEGDYIELSFEDQGCGIPEKDQAKIFTPFFTTKAEIGTGLGLATVHSIINRHGGAITFVSAVGRGTTFTLYLPASESDPAEPPAGEQQHVPLPADCSGMAILVMDDEQMIRDLIRDILEEQGCRVTLCANGEEALSHYRQAYDSSAPYVAAILDLTVPGGIGGKETAQHILAIDPAARLIVSSGYSQDVVMKTYQEHGFCAAVTKPYDVHELTHLLRQFG